MKHVSTHRLPPALLCALILCSGRQFACAATSTAKKKVAPAKRATTPAPRPKVNRPIDKLDVHLEVKSRGLQQYDKPGQPLYQKLEQNWEMSADLLMAIYADKAIAISKDPKLWKSCAEATTMCEVARGSSLKSPRIFGEPEPAKNPVNVSIQENNWKQTNKGLQHAFRLSTANVLNDSEVSLHIAFMPPNATGSGGSSQLSALTYKYRLVISGLTPYNSKDTAHPDTADLWDDFTGKWEDVSKDRRVTLRDWSALSHTDYAETEEGDVIQYATFDDTKALESYFSNPVGTKTFNLKAKAYVKANDWLEEHSITLTLSPHVEKTTGK